MRDQGILADFDRLVDNRGHRLDRTDGLMPNVLRDRLLRFFLYGVEYALDRRRLEGLENRIEALEEGFTHGHSPGGSHVRAQETGDELVGRLSDVIKGSDLEHTQDCQCATCQPPKGY